MDNLMENLNKEQLEAVTHKDGPLLIVAGAGTGKTTVITQRIAYLIEQGKAKPDEILALTFTEKAAGEMEERVDRLLPFGYTDLWISTFHGFGERVLAAHGLDIGLPAGAKLLNEFEQYALIKKNIDKFDLDYYRPLGNPNKFIHALVKHFSRAKDEDISSADYLAYAQELKENMDAMLSGKKIKDKNLLISDLADKNGNPDKEVLSQEVARINEVANAYHVYQQLLLDNEAMDFGDLINYCLKLFRERPAILEKYRRQFKYILLDEFQDTNWAQYELIKMLASGKNNLTVVGDDDQCLPGSSRILVKDGEKRIDKIKQGEEVATAVGKGYFSYSKVKYINKSKKKTRLLKFTTKQGHTLEVTDNHKMFCFVPSTNRLSGNKENFFYVYLMYKQELGWRMGITRDLPVRLRLERSADKIVAVLNCLSEDEARYYEILYSLKYGIPTICFMERGGKMEQKKWTDKLYAELNVQKGVNKLSSDLGIDLNSPQVCLAAVNRGSKLRIKINIEMCVRRYRTKYDKKGFLKNPKVIHLLSLETSDRATIDKLEKAGFKLLKARKGKRIRIYSSDLPAIGKIAKKLEKITGGIIENKISVGKINKQHKKALVIPAGNVFPGMYLPIKTAAGIVYDRVIKRESKNKEINVYDLEVERTHNFIANNIVVHNSVYKFRGASLSNILQFKKDYPDAKEIVLINNYRSRQAILDLAYNFIQLNNPNRLEYALRGQNAQGRKKEKKAIDKKLTAHRKGKAVIELIRGENLGEELRLVAEKIADLKIADSRASWNDFAVLVRANESAKEVCATLDAAGLPYQFLASRGLYTKSAILDITAYFKLLDNYHESSAVFRLLNMEIFKFTDSELADFNFIAKKKAWSLYTVLKNMNGKLGRETQAKIKVVLDLIEKHTALARRRSASEIMIAFLNDSGYLKNVMDKGNRESAETIAYLNKFISRIHDFETASDDKTIRAFLDEFNLEIESGSEGAISPDIEAGPEAIKIMTVHAAKGLEFKYVFLVNLVDKRFPTIERREAIEIPDALVKEILPEGDIHLQEERRLFYVAITRAKDNIYFSWAPDYGGKRKKKPSRFLVETELLPVGGAESGQSAKDTDTGARFETKKRFKAKKAPLKLPGYFSYTQLAAFDNCPYQYYLAHIIKVPRRSKHTFSFGQTMHSTLQKIFQMASEKRGFGQADLFGKTEKSSKGGNKVKITFDEIMKLYEDSWIDEWYESEGQKKEYWKLGKESLKNFYEKHKDDWPNTIQLEEGVNLKIGGYRVFGKIDRVDEINGGLRIVDYKTGMPKVKEKIDAGDKEQLLIYQLAAEQAYEKKIINLQFYYLNNNSEINFIGTDKELREMEGKILDRIEKIKDAAENDNFSPKPGPLCKFCDFAGICEFRKA